MDDSDLNNLPSDTSGGSFKLFSRYFILLWFAYTVTGVLVWRNNTVRGIAYTLSLIQESLSNIPEIALLAIFLLPLAILKPKSSEYKPGGFYWAKRSVGPKTLSIFFFLLILVVDYLIPFLARIVAIKFGLFDYGLLFDGHGPVSFFPAVITISSIILVPLLRYCLFDRIIMSKRPWLHSILIALIYLIIKLSWRELRELILLGVIILIVFLSDLL